jgi:hypothetical protein
VAKFHIPRSFAPGDLMFADIQIIANPGYGGYKFRLEYVCDHSGCIFTFAIRNKSDAAKTLVQLRMMYRHEIRHIRTDGGGEFLGPWESQASKLHISFEHGPRDASIAFNSKAQRAHLSIDSIINSCLTHAGLD